MNFVLCHLLSLSTAPLPAKVELYAASLTEFVYCSLTSKGIKMNFMLHHLLNLSTAPLPANELK